MHRDDKRLWWKIRKDLLENIHTWQRFYVTLAEQMFGRRACWRLGEWRDGEEGRDVPVRSPWTGDRGGLQNIWCGFQMPCRQYHVYTVTIFLHVFSIDYYKCGVIRPPVSLRVR